uniref:hypothetical protein n=1 Tax=Phenylobacterium sp. TaxID=1871053 RepID=UPI0025EADFF7
RARARARRARQPAAAQARPADPAPPTPARDASRFAERRDALRLAAQRVVWSEYEPADYENEAGYYFDLIEQRLARRARDSRFGLVAQDDDWAVEPLDDRVVRLCRDLGLPEAAARAWRDLPDPPPEAFERPDDADDEDEDDEDGDDDAPPPDNSA